MKLEKKVFIALSNRNNKHPIFLEWDFLLYIVGILSIGYYIVLVTCMPNSKASDECSIFKITLKWKEVPKIGNAY